MSDVSNRLASVNMGINGGVLVTDATVITGNFRQMVVLETATFTTLTTGYTKNGDTVATAAADWGTLYEGTVLPGDITAVTLASGKVLLLR